MTSIEAPGGEATVPPYVAPHPPVEPTVVVEKPEPIVPPVLVEPSVVIDTPVVVVEQAIVVDAMPLGDEPLLVEPPDLDTSDVESAEMREALETLLDTAIGAAVMMAARADSVGRQVSRGIMPFARVVLRPPLVPTRFQPGEWLGDIAQRGNDERKLLREQLEQLLDETVPVVTAEFLPRVDMATLRILVDEVIDAIDLPEIIRQSTGGVAAETVRGARMQAIAGDEAVSRVMDRLLFRRNGRATEDTSPVPEKLPGRS